MRCMCVSILARRKARARMHYGSGIVLVSYRELENYHHLPKPRRTVQVDPFARSAAEISAFGKPNLEGSTSATDPLWIRPPWAISCHCRCEWNIFA